VRRAAFAGSRGLCGVFRLSLPPGPVDALEDQQQLAARRLVTVWRERNGPLVETAEDQITRSRITITGFHSGKGAPVEKTIGQKVSSLSFKNLKFQFNRVVRSKLPF